MERRQKNGELQARSKKTEISYEVDEEAPSAEVRLNGKKQKQLFTSDFCVCSAENVQDDTEEKFRFSGILQGKNWMMDRSHRSRENGEKESRLRFRKKESGIRM